MTNEPNNSSDSSDSLSEEEEKRKLFDASRQKMFSTMRSQIVQDINNHMRTTKSPLSMFNADQVATFLQNPVRYERQIRQLSNYLYNVSPQYKLLIQYFATMPTYAYTLEPYQIPDEIDKEKYKKAYFNNLKDIEKMSLSHELIKVLKIAFKEDVFYGYILESRDNFLFMQLDADYCRLSSYNGTYNFAFDFSFFDSNKELISTYPDEFQEKYLLYKKDRNNKFIELDSNNTICIKINEELKYALPPLATIIAAVFDVDEYKKIKKQKVKLDNFLLLTQEIPFDEKSINTFPIDLDLAGDFHELLSEAVPDGVSTALSPLKIAAIRLEKSKTDQDVIKQATRELFADSGVPQQMFSMEGSTSTGLSSAIIVNEQTIFAVLRQIERWVNRRLTRKAGNYKFHIKFLNITHHNKDKVQDSYLKAAQSSMPVINEYAASLGMSPLDLYNKSILENDILGLHDMLRPLASSHTQTKDDNSPGRSKLADDEISDSGQINRDANTDEEKANK